ncbi:hypothetical protein JCM10049v2_006356 [Rhodotorula toruloides]
MAAFLSDRLQPLSAVTHNLPPFIRDPAVALLGQECYTALVWNLDLTSEYCLKLGLSKGLGLAMVAGGAILKLPQIITVVRSGSARGLSLSSYVLDTVATGITVAYNVRNGFPYSTWGEMAFLLAQNAVLIVLITSYSARPTLPRLAPLVVLFSTLAYALSNTSLVPSSTLSFLQTLTIPISLSSKVPQILSNFRNRSTGQLSAFLVFNSLAGCLARVFTTRTETSDPLLFWGFLLSALLNAVIAIQMLVYPSDARSASKRDIERPVELLGDKVKSATGVAQHDIASAAHVAQEKVAAYSTPVKQAVGAGPKRTASPASSGSARRYVRKMEYVALDILRRTAGSTRPHLSGQSPPNPPLLLFVLQPLAMALSTASAIDAHLREATADPYRNVPRAIFLAARSNDPLSYSRQAGWARLPETEVSREQLEKEGTPIKQDDIAEMYSCTKLCGSIAALQLLEEGKIALEDDASKFVKELKDVKIYKGFDKDGELILEENSTPITVRSLITHTAGFIYYFRHPDCQKVADKLGIETSPYGLDATRDSLHKMPLFHKPDEHWNYGTSIDWLTRIVEEISGQDLETYFQERIFKPLGITDVSFNDNQAQIDMAFADPEKPDAPYVFRRPTPYSRQFRYGGAGLKGSAPSYLKLVRALLRGGALEDESSRILRKETVDLMFKPHLTNEQQRQDLREAEMSGSDPFSRKRGESLEDVSWGLGGMLSGKGLASGRGGGSLHWSGMANTFWVVDREHDVCFVLFSNLQPYGWQPVFDLWEKVETELYKGLGVRAE